VVARVLRFLVRLAGWLLTPLVTIAAAALGALLATFLAPAVSPTVGVVLAGGGGLLGATLGFWLWLRLLSHSPELRDVLAVTPEGVPTEEAITDVIGDDPPPKPESTPS
jgi:hypothetical protein